MNRQLSNERVIVDASATLPGTADHRAGMVIRPRLEEWAEVATFDVPGVGDEPAVEPLDRRAIVDRALVDIDRRGWDSYILVCDGSALPTGIRVAHARPGAVEAMALGHARLVNRMEGEARP